MSQFFAFLLICIAFSVLTVSEHYQMPQIKGRHVVAHHEQLGRPGWKHVKPASPNDITSFTIHLTQNDVSGWLDHARSIVDPKSPNYSKWATHNEINSHLAPSTQVKVEVITWLSSHLSNIHIIDSGDSLVIHGASAGELSQLFQTEFHHFEHKESGKQFLRHHGSMSVPEELREHIFLVTGLSEFFHPKNTKYKAHTIDSSPLSRNWKFGGTSFDLPDPIELKNDPGASIDILPDVLKNMYNIPQNEIALGNNVRVSIAAFMDHYDPNALVVFNELLGIKNGSLTETPNNVDCRPQGCDNGESDLDTQAVSGLAQGFENWFWMSPSETWILGWAIDVYTRSQSETVPELHSISYGWGELAQCLPSGFIAPNDTFCANLGYDNMKYLDRTDTELSKLSSLGLSVQVSSGDDGAQGFGHWYPIDRVIINSTYIQPTMCGNLVTYSNSTYCNWPNAQFQQNCIDILQSNSDVDDVLGHFINLTEGNCFMTIDENNLHVLANCSCDSFTPFASGTATGTPWTLDLSNSTYSINGTRHVLSPDYPTSSPWVTSIGATQLSSFPRKLCGHQVPGGLEYNSTSQSIKGWLELSSTDFIQCPTGEKMANPLYGSLISSGGGFAYTRLAQPWQQSWIADALASSVPGVTVPPGGDGWFFNSTMRAYPDVTFNGHRWLVALRYNETDPDPVEIIEIIPVDGTSASSPGITSMFALLLARVRQSIPTAPDKFGLIAPLLYEMAENWPRAFNDITNGAIDCSPHLSACTPITYAAAPGYDIASGLGTPNFEEMFNYLMFKYNATQGPEGPEGPQGLPGTSGPAPTIKKATVKQCPEGGIIVTSNDESYSICNGLTSESDSINIAIGFVVALVGLAAGAASIFFFMKHKQKNQLHAPLLDDEGDSHHI